MDLEQIEFGHLFWVLGAFVALGWCALAILAPRHAWNLSHLFRLWQYEKLPEPSRAGLTWTRVSGIAVLVLCLVTVILRLVVP
ncbi:MAG: hypothetical protein GEV10_06280 [Streptosporangiales bacterium]|nr:hypothetical protein [Streptosporangiales bacterium]